MALRALWLALTGRAPITCRRCDHGHHTGRRGRCTHTPYCQCTHTTHTGGTA